MLLHMDRGTGASRFSLGKWLTMFRCFCACGLYIGKYTPTYPADAMSPTPIALHGAHVQHRDLEIEGRTHATPPLLHDQNKPTDTYATNALFWPMGTAGMSG